MVDLQHLSHGGVDYSSIMATTLVFFIFFCIFNTVCNAFGGASFNPTGNASFYAAGSGSDSLFSMALRFPAQALGAVGGAVAIMEVMPMKYKHMIGGPTLKVDMKTGAVVEGVLTFVISFIVLFISLRGPRSSFIKTWLIAIAVVTLVNIGSVYTGPAMNPAIAFGWAYLENSHNTWDQFYVYWICPFIGSILAAWLFRIVFPPKVIVKQKKA
ncbi:Aquaporin SIP1-1 [Stylosanthes scabra]|uniref:Aquaporin SIP1-1 n=1 Tax=Stylosanthes scabra TaxID=79078 RepID=A0ABU6U9J2_9FABA|nr:Aquaporin SIP1-1 [Stylosanthes scabra]